MDDFSATQICEGINELSQTQTPESNKRKQIGVLTIKNTECPIFIGINTIGRHITNQIVIKDASVSKHHAEIEGRKRTCFVTDLQSLNGTFDQFKEKFLPKKAYQLRDGNTIKIGQIEASFKQLNIATVPRTNAVIASTPDSVLNSTHDDSSVVYGTQAAQTVSSPSTSKFPKPKNLQNEFSKVDDSTRNEGGNLEKSTENISLVHEADTQVSIVNIQVQDENLRKIAQIEAGEEFELFSHLPYNVTSTPFKNIEQEPTQAFVPKKQTRFVDNPNIVPDSDSDEEDCGDAVEKVSGKVDQVFEQETQKIQETSISENSDNIHQETTQVFHEENFKEPMYKNPDKTDNIFQDETQAFSSTSTHIHQEETQIFSSPSTKLSLKSKNTRKVFSKLEDSDTDEEGIFQGPTQKVSTNLDNIHEATTQKITNLKTKDEDSETDEEGVFNEPTQQISTKLDKIHQEATQAIPIKAKSWKNASNNENVLQKRTSRVSNDPNIVPDSDDENDFSAAKGAGDNIHEDETQIFLKSDNIHQDKTQAFPSPSTKILRASTKHVKEYSKTFQTSEINFEAETQKIPNKADNLHQDETQKFSAKADDSHQDETQPFLSSAKSPMKFIKSLKTYSKKTHKIYSKSCQADEEIDFEGPTQKFSSNADNDQEEETQAFSNSIHQSKTQVFLSPSTSSSMKVKKIQKNIESDDFDGPTQKFSNNADNDQEEETQAFSNSIHQSKTQVFLSPGTSSSVKVKKNQKNIEFDTIDYDGPTQKMSDTTDKTETDEIDFEGPTQKYPGKSDNIHEAVTQTLTHRSENQDSDTDDEGVFQGIKQVSTKSPIIREQGAQVDHTSKPQKTCRKSVQFQERVVEINQNSLDKEDSDTDEEGLFERPDISTKSDAVDRKKSETAMSHQSGKEESNTDAEGVDSKVKNSKISAKSPKALGIKNLKLQLSVAEEEKISDSDKKIVTNSEADNQGISENKTENISVEMDGHSTPAVAGQTCSLSKQQSMEIDDFTGFSPRRSRRSATVHKKVEKITQKSNAKTLENENSKIHDDSDAEVESIFKNQEDPKTMENEKQRRQQKRNIPKTVSPNPSTSREQDSETKKQSVEKGNKNKPFRTSTHKRKVSNSEDDSSVDQDKIPTRKASSRKSRRLDKTSKTNEKEKISISKERIPESLDKKRERSTISSGEASNSERDTLSPSSSSTAAENKMESRFASVENFEYENAATQPIDDIDRNQTREKKINIKSPKKEKSTNISPSRRSTRKLQDSRLNDSIEDNLNAMFQGASDEIEEPHQSMMTQQLKNILEASQLADEPSTSRTRNAPKVANSKESAPASFKSDNSPQVNASNQSPRMSKLNIQIERPLKKRALRTNDVQEESSSPQKNKRVKQDENLQDDSAIRSQSLKSREKPKKRTSEADLSSLMAQNSKEIPNSNEAKTSLELTVNPRNTRKTSRSKLPAIIDADSSSSILDDSERVANSSEAKKNLKISINPKSTRITRSKLPAATLDSSSSVAQDSQDTSNSIPAKEENLAISKRGRRKRTNVAAIDATTQESGNISNANKAKENLKVAENPPNTRTTRKGKATSNVSTASSSFADSSLNETSSSKVEKTEPKKTRGRKPKNASQAETTISKNSSASSILSLPDSDLNSSTASTPSRAKRSRTNSPLKHKILFTGIPSKDFQKHLSKLGLNETEDVNKCTILVTDKVRRTFKFLCAISQGIPIVSTNWITDSAKKSSIQESDNYIINDPTAENKFNFNLKASLEKARNGKMLAGYTVLLTPNITSPPLAELKEMVTASGGKILSRPPTKWTKDTVIVSHEQDLENAKKFLKNAPKTVSLHSTEFLLTGILKQEIDLKSYLIKST